MIERICGSVVSIYFSNYLTKENYNKQSTGNYLIKSITHLFTQGSYFQVITGLRTGMNDKINNDVITTTKAFTDKLKL